MADIKFIVEVDGVEQVVSLNQALKGTTPAAKQAGEALTKAGKAQDNFSRKSNGVRKNTNRMNATIQNVGFQVGDLAVQLQSGQNALVAFSQQGAQLAGLLPGVAGAIAGVGIVAGVQFLKSTGLANDALEKMAQFFLNAEGAAKRFSETLSEAGGFASQLRALDPEVASPGQSFFFSQMGKLRVEESYNSITLTLDKQRVSLDRATESLQQYQWQLEGDPRGGGRVS